jgi:hypothetical protein
VRQEQCERDRQQLRHRAGTQRVIGHPFNAPLSFASGVS